MELRIRKALLCERTLQNEFRKGNVPLFAVKKFLMEFRDTPSAKNIAVRAAHKLAELGEHRLSALLHLDSDNPIAAAEQLGKAGMFYPAIHLFRENGRSDCALELAGRLIDAGKYSSERELFEGMDCRVEEARALLSNKRYLEASHYLLSFMMVKEALECAEALERRREYIRAVDVYLPLGILHKALGNLIQTIEAIDVPFKFDAGLSQKMKEVLIERWCCSILADSCLRNEGWLEREEFRDRSADMATLFEESVEGYEALPHFQGLPDMPLIAGMEHSSNGDTDAALKCGEELENLGLHLSAAKLYAEMGKSELQSSNLILAGEFEDACRVDISRSATGYEAGPS
jgi:tetratricopeptide (TPR) repeat protein